MSRAGAAGQDEGGATPLREIVLLPGWGMPPATMDSLQTALSPLYRVTVLALPDGDSLAAMAAATLAVAPPRATWIGWSLGGMVAAQAAAMAPARVSALVTLASNLVFVARDDWPQAMPAADFAEFLAQFSAEPATAVARFLALQCRGAPTAREDLRGLRAALAAAPATAATRSGLAVLRDSDLRGVVAGLSPPSLWLYAAHDALVPAAVAAAVAARVPGARTGLLADASHASFLRHPASLVAALTAFLPEYA